MAMAPCIKLGEITTDKIHASFELKCETKTLNETTRGSQLSVQFTDGTDRILMKLWGNNAIVFNKRLIENKCYRIENAYVALTDIQRQKPEHVMYELTIPSGKRIVGFKTLTEKMITSPPITRTTITGFAELIGRRLTFIGIVLQLGPISLSKGERPQTIQEVLIGGQCRGKVTVTLWGNQTVRDLQNDDIVEVIQAFIGEFERTVKIRSCQSIRKVSDPDNYPFAPGTFHFVGVATHAQITPSYEFAPMSLVPSLSNNTTVRTTVTPTEIVNIHCFDGCPKCFKSVVEFDGEFDCAEHGPVTPISKLVGNIKVKESLLVLRFYAERLHSLSFPNKANPSAYAKAIGNDQMRTELALMLVGRTCDALVKKGLSKANQIAYDLVTIQIHTPLCPTTPPPDTPVTAHKPQTTQPDPTSDGELDFTDPAIYNGQGILEDELSSDDN